MINTKVNNGTFRTMSGNQDEQQFQNLNSDYIAGMFY